MVRVGPIDEENYSLVRTEILFRDRLATVGAQFPVVDARVFPRGASVLDTGLFYHIGRMFGFFELSAWSFLGGIVTLVLAIGTDLVNRLWLADATRSVVDSPLRSAVGGSLVLFTTIAVIRNFNRSHEGKNGASADADSLHSTVWRGPRPLDAQRLSGRGFESPSGSAALDCSSDSVSEALGPAPPAQADASGLGKTRLADVLALVRGPDASRLARRYGLLGCVLCWMLIVFAAVPEVEHAHDHDTSLASSVLLASVQLMWKFVLGLGLSVGAFFYFGSPLFVMRRVQEIAYSMETRPLQTLNARTLMEMRHEWYSLHLFLEHLNRAIYPGVLAVLCFFLINTTYWLLVLFQSGRILESSVWCLAGMVLVATLFLPSAMCNDTLGDLLQAVLKRRGEIAYLSLHTPSDLLIATDEQLADFMHYCDHYRDSGVAVSGVTITFARIRATVFGVLGFTSFLITNRW